MITEEEGGGGVRGKKIREIERRETEQNRECVSETGYRGVDV